MKKVNKDLEIYLNTAKNLTSCDLYELDLLNGLGMYFADTDMDVTYNGRTYLHDKLIIKRNQIKLNERVSVDSMTVTIYADKNNQIGSVQALKAAHDGILDGASLYLRRVFFKDSTILGVVPLFGGNVEIKSAGGLKLQLTVKAKTQGLSMGFPIRKYYPQGTYSIGTDQIITEQSTNSMCLIAPFVPRKEVLL